MIPRVLVAASLFALVIPVMGCAAEVTAAPPPPPPVTASAEVTVEGEPPPPPPVQVEVVPAPPAPDYYWVAGYHRWYGGRYVWVPGRYMQRPHPAARWEPAHWEARGRVRVWVEGRWL
jgi:hypothetical protein